MTTEHGAPFAVSYDTSNRWVVVARPVTSKVKPNPYLSKSETLIHNFSFSKRNAKQKKTTNAFAK